MANITSEQLRSFLQFDKNDYPSPEDMDFFIELAEDKISLDLDSTNETILRLATYMLSKAMVLRGLATRSVGKGYITINAEGRNITKSYQELVLEAENIESEYNVFILSVGRNEVTSTQFMNDSSIIDAETRQQIIDIQTGTQNAMDMDSYDKTKYGRARRS